MSMIGQPKALASLSSTLLARKGHARPAMRPQGFGGFGSLPGAQDDLGWNDMGDGPEMTLAEAVVGENPPPVPPVLIEREALQEELAAPVVADIAPARAVAPIRAAREPVIAPASKAGRVAFTLRIDADRHLRLRLASALQNRSAQILVTEALDALLANLPDVEALALQTRDADPMGDIA